MDALIAPLAASKEPWTRYRALIEALCGRSRRTIPKCGKPHARRCSPIRSYGLLDRGVARFGRGAVLSSHKSSSQPFHKLAFLVRHRSPDRRSRHAGSSLQDFRLARRRRRPLHRDPNDSETRRFLRREEHLGALRRAGHDGRRREHGLVHTAGIRAGGDIARQARPRQRLALPAVQGRSAIRRGPGRKEDPCPFATLGMLELCRGRSRADAMPPKPPAGAEIPARTCGKTAANSHPYMFFMGSRLSAN
ncbi:MAG: hypothetical protein M0C28_18375 [Candidatus Moduliflexus flocculans]|nr:hypothetical protein [Candidatus Moduliflexus flocculans]